MKNFLPALLALVLLSAGTAPAARAQGLTYGVKAGVNYANLWGVNAQPSRGFRFGPQAGLTLRTPLARRYSLQFDLLYSQKGYRISSYKYTDEGGATFRARGTQVLNYVDLPMVVQANFGQFFVEAGPRVSYLINSRLRSDYKVTDASGNTVYRHTTSADKDALIGYAKIDSKTGGIPHFDVGLVAGAGYYLKPNLTVGVRYDAGVKSLVDTRKTPAGDEPRVFNHAFQVQVGYLLATHQ